MSKKRGKILFVYTTDEMNHYIDTLSVNFHISKTEIVSQILQFYKNNITSHPFKKREPKIFQKATALQKKIQAERDRLRKIQDRREKRNDNAGKNT